MSPEQFSSFAEVLQDPCCLLLADGTIAASNSAARRLFGVVGTAPPANANLREFVDEPEDKLARLLKNWSRSKSPLPARLHLKSLDQGKTCHCRGRLLTPASEGSPAEIVLLSKSHDSSKDGFLALNEKIEQLRREIVTRRQAEEALRQSEEHVRLLLDSTGEAIYGVDRDGRCTFANPACVSILGYDNVDELIGASILRLLDENGRDDAGVADHDSVIARAISQSEPLATEDEVMWRKDGGMIPAEVRVTPMVRQGKLVGSVVTFSDISERKRAQAQILSMNVDLERRVEERTEALQVANQELETSIVNLRNAQQQLVQSEKMAALGGLVAGVAHEINTPIGVGVTAASHLAMKLDQYNKRYRSGQLTRSDFEAMLGTGLESSEMILANLERAAELIRSFKQVAVDQSSGEARAFKLTNYIDEILRSLHPKLKRTQHVVEVECDGDVSIYSFPGAFSQIITNLVMNSLVHGFEGMEAGTITIRVTKRDNWVCLEYADNGKGIAQEYIKKVFDPFFTTKRGSGGSGLGLHIVFNLVTQTLGGRIECFSTPGEGVLFKIDCPDASNSSALEASGA